MPNSFTPQEIERFLQEFFDTVGTRQYTGARYVPIFGRAGSDTVEWDDLAPYEPLTVVMHEGVSYVSRRYVPRGIQITDTAYWVETYRFNAQVEQYRQEVLSFQGQIDQIQEDYVPFPDPDTYPKYGQLGQVLTTLTDGATMWDDPVHVTADIAEPLIEQWLDDHPEATTTVQDGSITDAKMAANSFYSQVFMPRQVPGGTTALTSIATDGSYHLADATAFTDIPTGVTGSATLLVFSHAFAGNFSIQFLMKTQGQTWLRIVNNGTSQVYYGWVEYLSAEEQQALEAGCMRGRAIPSGTAHFYQLTEPGIYMVTAALAYDDRPAGLTSNYATLVNYGPAFNGDYVIQYVYQTGNRVYMRMLNTTNNTGSWVEMPADKATTYTNKTFTGSPTLLSTFLESGSYHNLYKAFLTDWPAGSSAPTGTLFVIGTAFNGDYVLQLLFTTASEVWMRVWNKTAGTVYRDWNMIVNATNTTDQTLAGKVWSVCGDSFSHGDFTDYTGDDDVLDSGIYAGQSAVYAYLIGNRTGVTVNMLAQNGMTLATPADASTSNCFTNTAQPYNYTNVGNCDYLTLYFGINDSHQSDHIPVGTIDDTTVNTFYGAYNVVLQRIINDHPNTHIGIIVTNGAETDDYRQATIAVANKWGIPYIDLNGDQRTPMMLRSTNPNVTATAKTMRNQAWQVNQTTNGHPNPAAHRYESLFIESFLKSI